MGKDGDNRSLKNWSAKISQLIILAIIFVSVNRFTIMVIRAEKSKKEIT